MSDAPELRDLGPIVGREVAVPATGGPTGSAAAGPGPRQQRRVAASLTTVREGTARALADVRDAHRRGPKPNTRPVPAWVRRLAWVLDDAFEVPGTGGRRVGIDGFLTLVPGIGDAAGVVLSMVVVLAGVGAGVSIPTLLRMLLNVGFEGLFGLVPFLGALFDMAYKANDRNVRLIEADLSDRRGTRRSSIAVLVTTVLALVLGAFMLVAFFVLGVAVVVWLAARWM